MSRFRLMVEEGSATPERPVSPVAGAERTPPTTPAPERISCHVAGVRIDCVTEDQAIERILELARRPGADVVLTPNVDHILRTRRIPEFKAIYDNASLVVADGMPVVWASRILGQPLPERVAGSDLMPRCVVAAARAGLTYFFVGGMAGDAEQAARILADRAGHDGLVGIDCPPYGFEQDTAYVERLVERINAASPNLLFVGLGSPKQEFLIDRLRSRVAVNVMMGVGVTFSFVAGTVRRAPKLMQRLGLEWMWRLACEPRRLWRRYLDNLVRFPLVVLADRVRGARVEKPS